MKLKPINIVRLPILDSGAFIERYITDYINQNIDPNFDPEFKDLHTSLVNQSPIFNQAILQIRAKAESVELLGLDLHRDRKVITLRRVHSTFEYTDVEEEKKAYLEIKTVLKTYKNIEAANYEAESLAIDNLIADLRNDQYKPFTIALGLGIHVDRLEASNKNFKVKFDARSTETISTEVFDTKVLRTTIFETYKELAEYILVMAKRKPQVPEYKKILDILNNGREYFATLLAKREGGDKPAPTDGK